MQSAVKNGARKDCRAFLTMMVYKRVCEANRQAPGAQENEQRRCDTVLIQKYIAKSSRSAKHGRQDMEA